MLTLVGAEAMAFAERQGALYAPTAPLIGPTVDMNFTSFISRNLPRSLCAPLAASVDMHTLWFKGGPLEEDHRTLPPKSASARRVTTKAALQRVRESNITIKDMASQPPPTNQQDGERAFVDEIKSLLCANPSQTEDEYTEMCA